MPDVIIIGAGAIGLLTARELVLAGARVTVVDRSTPGTESSWAGGGILSPLHPWRYPSPVTDLARWGQDHYPALAAELFAATGIDPEYFPCGLLVLDATDEARARDWASASHHIMEYLSPEDLARSRPWLSPGHRGLWLPELANIRNPRLMQALYTDLQARGVEFRLNTRVTDLLIRDRAIHGVRTSGGEIAGEQVVLAAGAWSRQLGNLSGLDLPVRPVKGQMLLLETRPGTVPAMVLSPDHYLIPRRDGLVLAGSTLEHKGFDKTISDEARHTLATTAGALVPALAQARVVHHWAGLRPGTPAGIPIIGPDPATRGLYVNTGHYRNGVVLGPGSARLLADLLLRRQPSLEPRPFLPVRREYVP